MSELDTPEELASNQPFLLNGRNELWRLVQGNIDIFAVTIEAGAVIGAREHICRLQPGQMLAGLGDSCAESDMGLLAVGLPGTKWLCLGELAQCVATRAPSEMAAWLDEWIIMLNIVLRQSSSAAAMFQDEIEQEQHEGVIWLGDTSVTPWIPVVLWMPMQQVRSRTVVLPLNLQAWMASIGEGDLVCQNTEAVIRAGQINIGLTAYYVALLERLLEQRKQRRQAEHQCLLLKATVEAQQFNDALAGMSQIMNPDQEAFLPFNGWTGAAGIDACLLVLEASGISSPLRKGEKVSAESHTVEDLILRSRAATRKVGLTGERWWAIDAGPLLAERKGQPVALLPRASGGYWLVDPVTKSREVLNANNASEFGERALSFFRTFPAKPVSVVEALRLGSFGIGGDLSRLLAVGIAGGLLALLIPFGTEVLIDNIIPNASKDELWQMILLWLSATIGISAFELTRAIAMQRISSGRTGNALQMALVHRLLFLPAMFFRRYTAADLSNRLLGVGMIFRLLNGYTQAAVLGWFFGLSSLICLLFIDTTLASVAVLLVMLELLLIVGLNRLRLKLEQQKYLVMGQLASRIFQLLNGIGKLRASGAEKRAFTLWAKDFTRQKELDYRARKLSNIIAVIEASYPIVASMLLFAVTAFYLPNLSTGDFVFFNTAFSQFLASTSAMFTAFTLLIPIIPLYQRAKPILQAVPELSETRKMPGMLTGAIEISHVTFRYTSDGPIVLNDLSIQIKPGEFIAFVGPSGSGKSTIYRLLLGFEQPEYGAIYYDGQDLSGLDIAAVRQQLGVVLQNGKLMPGDIFTNIVGSAPLTLDDAWKAAQIAGLADDIKAMPMGMHTIVAEGAGTFSGGQKQRLMIARAIVNNPSILLFDEATSALDNRTQAIISEGIEKLNATRIVIAHRLSTIAKADRIFVIDAGHVVESGNYDELMALEGVFAMLAKRQML